MPRKSADECKSCADFCVHELKETGKNNGNQGRTKGIIPSVLFILSKNKLKIAKRQKIATELCAP